MKKNKISKNWIKKQSKDIFVLRSKAEGYRSRAVYKLIEINEKFNFLKNGISLIDLGAAPGSWTQYVSRKFKNSDILSIDIKEIEEIKNNHHIIGDFTEEKSKIKIKDYFKSKVDVILSDMAENTTGNKNLDAISTNELCREAMYFAKENLKENGSFVCKFFMGSTFKEIMLDSKKFFKKVKVYKPDSSRKNSKENFIFCRFLR